VSPSARTLFSVLLVLAGRIVADPMPFDRIRNPLSDTVDQRTRDSVLMKISRVRVNQAGYRTMDVAQGRAYVYGVGAVSAFKVIDAATRADVPGGAGTFAPKGGSVAGSIKTKGSNWAGLVNGGDTRYTMSSPVVSGALSEAALPVTLPAGGPYRVVAGTDTSAAFVVDDNVYGMVRDGILKFFGIARSGFAPSWFHKPSHVKDGSLAGAPGAYSGGWYDCGDHLKEGITMGYSMAMLATMASALQDRDQDLYGVVHSQTLRRDGIPDVLRELRTGGDFVLNSYARAGKDVTKMVTSVGDFGKDHQWWGRPELQDAMPLDRGGATSRILRVELGANVLAPYAGGLAVLSKLYAQYDSAFAVKALEAAKALYAEARANPKRSTNTPAYNGSGTNHDDLALSAVFLLWATRDPKYLQDLAYDKTIGDKGNNAFWTAFQGGWMAYADPTLLKGAANQDWGSVHSTALYAFAKLILRDSATAALHGVTSEAERKALQEKVVFTLICNLADVGKGGSTIALPKSDLGWKGSDLKYDPTWFSMHTQQTWVWNRYQAGNSAELFYYYDITGDIEGRPLPHNPANTDWKREQVRTLLVRQMDYFLGVNPWDISMILGLGDKNPNHPHHRASNPEGRNTPGTFYPYVVPTGAIYGGWAPDATGTWGLDDWNDYYHTETCIDGAATMIIPAMGLARDVPDTAGPVADVKVVYVSDTSAIVSVELDEWGTVALDLGLDSLAFPRHLDADSAGMIHRFEIGGLTRDTQYWFTVTTVDPKGNRRLQTHFGTGVRYGFRTRAVPPSKAEIANVKVCNVTADSAEILWFTPDGPHGSEIRFGETAPPTQYQEGDLAGVPVKFHRMKIGGLKEKTTYRFEVGSDGTWDNNGGSYYTFTTPVKSVLFDVRTTSYMWGTLPAMGMAVVNQDVVAYDSLDFRMYMRGDSASMADFAARVDIGFKYKSDGFIDSAFKQVVDNLLQKQKPILVPGSCNASGVCDWYFTIPTGPTQMEPGARFRLDVVFVRRNLPWNNDLLNTPPTKALGPTDWSWRPHSQAAGDPMDYPGVPTADKEDVDNIPWEIPVNPYIVVYRRGEFVYGFSPSAAENATKRTDWVIASQLDAPWNVPDGSVVELAGGKQVRVKGRAKVTDRLLPTVTGAVTDIWVNGKRLTDAQRDAAAVWDPVARDWILDIPVPLQNGGNQVNVTLFGGAATCSTTCLENGCAFVDRSFFVNFVSNYTPSSIKVVDGRDSIVPGRVVPDSSRLAVVLDDGNANMDRSRAETVVVQARNRRTGAVVDLVLTETGINTGLFRTSLLDVVPGTALAGQVQVPGEDTVRFRYLDAADETDSSVYRVWSPSAWAQPVSASIHRACGGGYEMRVRFDKPLPGPAGDDTATLRGTRGDSVVATVAGASTGWNASRLELVAPLAGIPDASDRTGSARIGLVDGNGSRRSFAVAVADSVGPWIDSAKIVENLDGLPTDTVVLWLSEGIGAPAPGAVPVSVRRAGTVLPLGTIDGFRLDDASARRWILTLPAGKVRAGDSLALASLVRDPAGIAAEDCPELRRRTGLLVRPVAMSRAWISDADGDGRADQVAVAWKRPLRAGDVPDSVVIRFGAGDSMRISAGTASVGDTLARIPFAPYSLSTTRGSGLGREGSVSTFRAGESLGSREADDSVGPALLQAALRFGASHDTVELRFSEPVSARGAGDWLQILRGGWTVLDPVGVPSATVSNDVWLFAVDTFAVLPGDSVRPVAGGRWVDAGGVATAPRHPGVPVSGRERPPVGAWMLDLDGDGAAETIELLWSRTPRTRPELRLAWPSAAGGWDSAVVRRDGWTVDPDSVRVRLPVGPFDRGVTAASRTDLGAMIDADGVSPFPVFDRVPPVLLRAQVRYGAKSTDSDTLLASWSEPLAWSGLEPLLQGRHGDSTFDLKALSTAVRSDSLGAVFLLDPQGAASTSLRRGDSLRLATASAATVADRSGNPAADPGRYVPVEFGRRPPRQEITFSPTYRRYEGWDLRGLPPFQIQVRPQGATGWTDLSTGRDVSELESRQIGPVISTNQPLRGTAILYDNQGTFLASLELDVVGQAFLAGGIETDGGNQYQVRLAWNGVAEGGTPAGSGVYTIRLVLRQNLAADGEVPDWTLSNTLHRFGWDVPMR